jgi:hypothetical protein
VEEGPSWLGIGAQRSGTTWFVDLLIQHPLMDVADGIKEHHTLYRFGLMRDWNKKARQRYKKTFESGDVKLGEFTPYYMRSPWTVEIAKDALPDDAPLLVLVRDPIDRFASALRHDMDTAVRRYRKHQKAAAEKKEKVNKYMPRPLPRVGKNLERSARKEAIFDEVAQAASKRWVKGPPGKKRPQADRTWLRFVGSDSAWGGMYASQLAAWTKVFPKDRFIVIQYEKLRRDPQHYADLVWKRLGLDPVEVTGIEKRSVSSSKNDRWQPDDHPHVVRGLQEMYRPDAERLAAEWDIDLSLWKRTMTDV